MTSLNHLYSDLSPFVPAGAGAGGDLDDEEALEEAKLVAFESGYTSGWDDAVAAKTKEAAQLSSEFVQHIEDMSFTYHEAFAKLSVSMKPLLLRFVKSLLPEAAQQNLRPRLLEQIETLIEDSARDSIAIAVAPQNEETIANLLEGRTAMPFAIEADPALSPAQAFLRVAEDEREINLDAVVQTIDQAVEAFLDGPQTEVHND